MKKKVKTKKLLKNKLNVFKRGRKSHKKLLKITYTFSDLEKRKGEFFFLNKGS